MQTQNIRDNVDHVIADLVRLRDEARVRLNLLGKELRDRWQEVEPEVENLIQQARGASESALERACELRDELRRELRKGDKPPAS